MNSNLNICQFILRKTWECVGMDSKMIHQGTKFFNLDTCTRDSEFKKGEGHNFWLC